VSEALPVLLYDGDCAFCTSCVTWMRRRIRRLDATEPYQLTDLDALGVTAPSVSRPCNGSASTAPCSAPIWPLPRCWSTQARAGLSSGGRFGCPASAGSAGPYIGGFRGTATGFRVGRRHVRSMVDEAPALVEFSGEPVEAGLVGVVQESASTGIDRRRGQQLRPGGVGPVEGDLQRCRQRGDRVGVVVGQQPFGVDLVQPSDGGRSSIGRSSIDQGAPCSANRGRNGSAGKASGPLTP
jgi:hypothetical protein